MKFDIITIFPEIFDSYFKESILKRAQDRGLIKISVHNLRDWSDNKHKTVDDKPFGGGRGMVMKIGPVYRAVEDLKPKTKAKSQKTKVILFSPRGKRFTQKMATDFSKLERLIMICGRYEGIDERVAKRVADMSLSLGSFVSMGGELPAMLVVEVVSRLIPGVIAKPKEVKERITKKGGFIEYPQYTRPEVFEPAKRKKWRAPKVLLSGNHKEIEDWRKKHSKTIK